jgi:hypothetical protein
MALSAGLLGVAGAAALGADSDTVAAGKLGLSVIVRLRVCRFLAASECGEAAIASKRGCGRKRGSVHVTACARFPGVACSAAFPSQRRFRRVVADETSAFVRRRFGESCDPG